jgi:hypothetical protein
VPCDGAEEHLLLRAVDEELRRDPMETKATLGDSVFVIEG